MRENELTKLLQEKIASTEKFLDEQRAKNAFDMLILVMIRLPLFLVHRNTALLLQNTRLGYTVRKCESIQLLTSFSTTRKLIFNLKT